MATVGDRVRIEQLRSARGQRLNGSYGLVIASAGDRLRVMLDDFSTGMFRPDNLVISNLDGIDFRQLFKNPGTVKDEAIEESRE
eukprot:COSAG06_NODE_12126_length_1420_cov_1.355791_1_plen_84_part_00